MAIISTALMFTMLVKCVVIVFSNAENDRNRVPNDINEEIKKVNARVGGVAKRVEIIAKIIEKRMDGVAERIDGVAERINGVAVRIDGVEESIEKMEVNENITLGQIKKSIKKLADKIERYHPTTTIAPTTTPISWVFYPPGTKEHKAKKYYPEYQLHFVGFGSPVSWDDVIEKHVTSFDECVELCVSKRKTDGTRWNGMGYRYHEQWCACGKNTKGHVYDKRNLHYTFE